MGQNPEKCIITEKKIIFNFEFLKIKTLRFIYKIKNYKIRNMPENNEQKISNLILEALKLKGLTLDKLSQLTNKNFFWDITPWFPFPL